MMPCAALGNIFGATTTAPQTIIAATNPAAASTSSLAAASSSQRSTTTPSSSMSTITAAPSGPGMRGCSIVDEEISSCDSASSGFSNLDFSSQASCFCYSSSSYYPSYFDDAWATCVNYLSVSESAQYASLSAAGAPVQISDPCSVVGDVLAGTTSSSVLDGGSDSTSARTTITHTLTPSTTSAAVNTQAGLTTASATTSSKTNEAQGLKANMALVVEIVVVMMLF